MATRRRGGCWLAAALAVGCNGCDRQRPVAPAPEQAGSHADWPMPNAPGLGLPNERRYLTGSAGVVTDAVTGLAWQAAVPAPRRSWTAAKQACDALTLAGWDDWRLPSRIELVSLIDHSRSDPAVDLAAFPFVPGGGLPADWFWTSTPAAGEPTKAWYVYFYFGYPDIEESSSELGVRCVRAGAPTSSGSSGPRYQLSADGQTARDLGTNLVWQRQASADSVAFQAAIERCAALDAGAGGGWRVPTLTELSTIVSDDRRDPAIDVAIFPGATSDPFWTSSVFSDSPSRAWYVWFDRGSGLYDRQSTTRRVRCVR